MKTGYEVDFVLGDLYYQILSTKKQGVQVDYLIVDKFNTIWLCEVKFSKNPIGQGGIAEIQQKIDRLDIGKNYSI